MDSKKKTRPRNPALLPKIPVRISGNTPPIDIINKKHLTAGEEEVRRRVEIRAINFGCLLARKGALAQYSNDNEINIVILTETNITQPQPARAVLPTFTTTNFRCSKEGIR